jgi:predicted aconitase with swiveling domain
MIVKGKKILGGRSVEGEVMVQQENFSFFGDVNRDNGIINVGTNAGKSFKDKIFVFPQSKGSTLAPYVAADCKRNGVAPKAMLCQKADGVLAMVAILADIPTMDEFEKNIMTLVKTGDRVRVEPEKGYVEILTRD